MVDAAEGDFASWTCVAKMKNGTCIDDQAIKVMASLFNKEEARKAKEDANYRPSHMFSTHFVSSLSGLGPSNSSVVRHKPENVKRWLERRVSEEERGKGLGGNERSLRNNKAALDIFECNKLLFPLHNESKHHFVLIEVDVESMRTSYFCSLGHQPSQMEKKVAKNCYKWVLDKHLELHGTRLNHPSKLRSLQVNDGNAVQEGVDCGLHALTVGFFRAWNRSDLLANLGRRGAGLEARRRVLLSMLLKKLMFAPLDTAALRAASQEDIASLRNEVKGTSGAKKKSSGKKGGQSGHSKPFWSYMAPGEKNRGKAPICQGCKKEMARSEEPRLMCKVVYKTKTKNAQMTEKLQVHCRAECILNLSQPKSLNDRPKSLLEEFAEMEPKDVEGGEEELRELMKEVARLRGSKTKKRKSENEGVVGEKSKKKRKRKRTAD